MGFVMFFLGKSTIHGGLELGKSFTLWLFNIAMENHHFL